MITIQIPPTVPIASFTTWINFVCGWCHIRREDTAINNQTCYRKNTGNEDTYVYFKHTCRCCSLLSCVWGIPSAYSILHVFHPPRTYKVWPIIKHTPQQKNRNITTVYPLRFPFYSFPLKLYEISCDINRTTYHNLIKMITYLFLIIILHIMWFFILGLNDCHYFSIYRFIHLPYPLNIWGCGGYPIKRGCSTTKNTYSHGCKINEDIYVYLPHICASLSLMYLLWSPMSIYSILNQSYPSSYPHIFTHNEARLSGKRYKYHQTASALAYCCLFF